ncbi:hypothetical protein HHI36_014221 [Cryptolaemus montrouzieri]|uniref:PiggyBac transposable element-derived protein 4 C-terminal zinc-ribbon domain-containing protein n=1 Tax=Cryptolaemus montrouzieri TaxID=559131 RepID=A0ABD2N1W6_9CUCU
MMKRICPGEKDCASLLIFRRNIAMSLLQTYGKPSAKGKLMKNPMDDTRYDGLNHWPEYITTKRLCRFCSGKSKFICTKCGVGLHPKLCFKNFHTFQVTCAHNPIYRMTLNFFHMKVKCILVVDYIIMTTKY